MYLARRNRNHDTLNRLFHGFFGGEWPFAEQTQTGYVPYLDVSETDAEYRVRLEIPGVAPANVEVALDENVLTVSGEKKSATEDEGENYRRVERHYGSFSRSVRLPVAVDANGVDASSKDGVLTVVLPKRAEARPRTIEVKIAD